MALAIAIPFFYAWRAPKLLGFTAIIMTVLMVEVLLIGNLLMEEEKYPKAEMLLCSSPYKRKMMIMEKYIFCFIIFVYCCTAYNGVALFSPDIAFLNMKTILLILLINTVLFGIYFPLQYKFGIQSTKLLLTLGVFAFPLLLSGAFNFVSDRLKYFRLENLSGKVQYLLMIFCIILMTAGSFYISNKFIPKRNFKFTAE